MLLCMISIVFPMLYAYGLQAISYGVVWYLLWAPAISCTFYGMSYRITNNIQYFAVTFRDLCGFYMNMVYFL